MTSTGDSPVRGVVSNFPFFILGKVYDATRFTFVTFFKNGASNSTLYSYLILYDALDAVIVKTTMSDSIKHSAF